MKLARAGKGMRKTNAAAQQFIRRFSQLPHRLPV
jgi:hypothetical protein